MDNNLPVPQASNALAELYGFDFQEMAAQVKDAQEAQSAPKASFAERMIGKINVTIKNTGQKFQFTPPEEMAKPEEERNLKSVAQLKGIILPSRFGLKAWPQGEQKPTCFSIGYMSKAIDPTTGHRKEIKENPVQPYFSSQEMIEKYQLKARRRVEAIDADGQSRASWSDYSCATCMVENEARYFGACNVTGTLEFLVLEVGNKQLAEPFVMVFQLSASSVRAYHQYTSKELKRFQTVIPSSVVTLLEVKQEKAKTGEPYDRLSFQAVAPVTPVQELLAVETLNKLKEMQAASQPAADEAPQQETAQAASAPASEEQPAATRKAPF